MGSYLIKNLLKICAASLGMALTLYGMKTYFHISSLMIFTAISIIIGVIVYFILVLLLKVDELDILKKRFKRGSVS
jgi:hypothetical protein